MDIKTTDDFHFLLTWQEKVPRYDVQSGITEMVMEERTLKLNVDTAIYLSNFIRTYSHNMHEAQASAEKTRLIAEHTRLVRELAANRAAMEKL